jgi:hypothetical protein
MWRGVNNAEENTKVGKPVISGTRTQGFVAQPI